VKKQNASIWTSLRIALHAPVIVSLYNLVAITRKQHIQEALN